MATTRLSAAIAASAGLAVSSAALAQYSQNFESTAVGSLPAAWSTATSGAGSAWAVNNTSAHGGSNSVFTNDVGSASGQTLTLPPFIATGPVTLDLWRSYTTEANWDGWIVETSVNGSAFANIGTAAWTLNGYNGTLNAGSANPLQGQQAFTGAAAAWTESTASIPANNGDTLAIRIRMGSDGSVASTGVWLDDVTVSNVTTAPTGACCVASLGCIVTAPADCTGQGGTYHGNNSTCASANCPLPPFTNGGFESGAFAPGWIQTGNGGFSAVADASFGITPEEGTYCAHFGPIGSTGTIQQVVPAHAGDTVTIDFWYQCVPGTTNINSFSADFNGQNLAAFNADMDHQTWTEFTFQRVAASDAPVLSFSFQNDPSYDYLDNVVVTVTAGGPTCYANCDHSTAVPFLNVQDFSCFLTKYASADPYANCDNSTTIPTLNVQDFSCFLTKYATGCSAP
jgi:hypothetical protein